MDRSLWIEYPGVFYHVTSRGNEKKDIFKSEADQEKLGLLPAALEHVRAHLRVIVKCILRKYGYPPDKQEKATQTALEQAELLSHEWAVA